MVSLIIPAYNEVGRIESTLKELMLSNDLLFKNRCELIVIMDGCTDETPEVVKNIISSYDDAVGIFVPNRLGKGGAIIEALKTCQADIIAFIDADGSIPWRELDRLIELSSSYDLVIGSRYAKNSRILSARHTRRVIFSRSFNVLLKLLFWNLRGIKDTQCGVKIFTRSLIDEIKEDFIVADFAFDVNLIYSAFQRGFKVEEVGIIWIEKEGSKLSPSLTEVGVCNGIFPGEAENSLQCAQKNTKQGTFWKNNYVLILMVIILNKSCKNHTFIS